MCRECCLHAATSCCVTGKKPIHQTAKLAAQHAAGANAGGSPFSGLTFGAASSLSSGCQAAQVISNIWAREHSSRPVAVRQHACGQHVCISCCFRQLILQINSRKFCNARADSLLHSPLSVVVVRLAWRPANCMLAYDVHSCAHPGLEFAA